MSAASEKQSRRVSLGEPLSRAEAAELLSREAAGERLPYFPRKQGAGFFLDLRSLMTDAEREEHAFRVEQVSRVLSGLHIPAAVTA